MKGKLKYYLQRFPGMDDQQIDDILKRFTTKTVTRNTILINEGETSKELYFIKSGCIRTYYLTKQGQEKTRYIGFEDAVVTSIASFMTQQPSMEYLDVLEDSELYAISHQNFYELVETVPAWAKFYSKLLEMAYLFQNQKITDLVTLSAKQRYEKLWNEKPAYIQRLSNKILASYLDIRQETLSRLKGK